jgi:GntR family transcriptional repressor for pyruvate dehydrogenase complex
MSDLFKKIPQKKISHEVFNQIHGLITGGKLKPGERLPPERELTSLFSVGRSSVREAILKLECLGYVQQRHGEGTFVKSATEAPLSSYLEQCFKQEHFLSDFMEIRNVMETWAAATAAKRATSKDIQNLKKCLDSMAKHPMQGKGSYALNRDFHFLIADATRNTFLIHFMKTISHQMITITEKVYADIFNNQEVFSRLLTQHTDIVAAIESRDSSTAYDCMKRHLSYANDKAREAGYYDIRQN